MTELNDNKPGLSTEALAKAGYKKTKVGWIPKEWEVLKFEDVSKVSQGLQIAIKDRLKKPVDGAHKYITIQYLNKGKDAEYVLNPSQSVLCKKDDILMTRTGNTGIVVSGVEGVFHNNFFKIKFDTKRVDRLYLLYFLNDTKTQNTLLVRAGSSTIPDLNHKDFYSIPIPLPPLPEQQKIATILSTWDRAIALTRKLLQEKEAQKKGLMQRLLTGKVRVKGFEGAWEKYVLNDLGNSYNGLTGKVKDDFGKGFPYISYLNVFNNPRLKVPKSDLVKINEGEKQNTAKYGDLFFTVSSETPNEVGMTSVLLDEVESVYLNSFCFGFRLNSFEILNPSFAQFFFRSEEMRKKISRLAQGSTRFNLSKNQLKKIVFRLPSIKEQTAIAAILTKADEEIRLLREKERALQAQKKGLMQRLLTGKVRVNL